MPSFFGLNAWVEVDGKRVEEYSLSTNEDELMVECWIPSEADKEFGIFWQYESSPMLIIVKVTMDGRNFQGIGTRNRRVGSMQYIRTSDTDGRSLVFRKIERTEEEQYLGLSAMPIGKIEVGISEGILHGEGPLYEIPDLASCLIHDTKVHESEQKAKEHCVGIGRTKTIPHFKATAVAEETYKMCTFIFHYAPLAMLQADGIAPGTKREQQANAQSIAGLAAAGKCELIDLTLDEE